MEGDKVSAHEKAVEAAETAWCTAKDISLSRIGVLAWAGVQPDENTRTEICAAITAYLASMQEQGFVIVPREATDDVVDAARHFLEPQTARVGRSCYRAMIDVAMLAAQGE